MHAHVCSCEHVFWERALFMVVFKMRAHIFKYFKTPVSSRFHSKDPARQNSNFGRNFAYFPLNFRLFLPMVPHPPFLSPHVYGIRLFPSIFRLKWYPILVINSSMEPICCFSTHMFTVSAYFLPIFHPTFCPYCPPVLSCRGVPHLSGSPRSGDQTLFSFKMLAKKLLLTFCLSFWHTLV